MNIRPLGIALLASAAVLLTSCKTNKASDGAVIDRGPAPSYQQVAAQHNRRANRLSRIWANATVRFTYLDENQKSHTEQGEGHFQFRAPDNFALSIGKLSEVLFWIGSDSDRYWFFQMYEGDRVTVGRNENIDHPCSADLGLPASPIDMIDLLGITPLDPGAPGATSWSLNGKWLVVDAPGRIAWRRLFLDPDTMLPARVDLYNPSDTTEPFVTSMIELNDRVELDGVGGFMPKAPSRLQIDHASSGTSIRLFLHRMNDGKTNDRLSDAVFDFNTLVEAFGPTEFFVLDADCPNPALPE